MRFRENMSATSYNERTNPNPHEVTVHDMKYAFVGAAGIVVVAGILGIIRREFDSKATVPIKQSSSQLLRTDSR